MGKLGYNSSNKIGPSFSTYSGLRDSGVLLPADIPNIAQWIYNYSGDFLYLDKADAPQLAKPINVGVPVLAFDGTQELSDTIDNSEMCRTGIFEIEFTAARTDTLAAERVIYGGATTYLVQFSTADRVQVVLYNGAGTLFVNKIFTLGVDSTAWQSIKLVGNGTNIEAFVDGNSVGVSNDYDVNFDGTAMTGSTSVGFTLTGFKGKMSHVKVDDGTSESFEYACTDVPALDVGVFNGVPTGNHSVSTANDPTNSTADDIPDHLTRYGYTLDTGAYIPALIDLVGGVRLDANGDPVGVRGSIDGARIHNGAPSGHQETEPDFTAFDGANLMGNGVDTWNELYYANYTGFVNGTGNVWIQWQVDNVGTAGQCIVKERVAHPVTKIYTLDEYKQMKDWAQKYTSSCGGGVVPFSVAAENGDDLITETGDLIVLG